MLFELLKMLHAGGVHTLTQIAARLDTSEALVLSMVDELVRLGYLKRAAQACSGSCQTCPVASACAIGARGRLWTLTEAGHRALQSGDR